MVDVNTATPTTPATANRPAPAAGDPSKGNATAISSDFETFLKMLTAQLQNQDPLNPLESTDFAVQLATFSGVEQQVKTNDLLNALSSQMATNGMTEMAGWVGKQARAQGPAWFDGTRNVTIWSEPATNADRAELVVKDARGNEMQRLEVPKTAETLDWNGLNANGTPFAPGNYSFELVSYSAGTAISTDPVAVYQTVREIRSTGTGTVLLLEGGNTVPTEQVTALRDPAAF